MTKAIKTIHEAMPIKTNHGRIATYAIFSKNPRFFSFFILMF